MAGDRAHLLRFRCSNGEQAECLHHSEGSAVAADLTNAKKKLTPGESH